MAGGLSWDWLEGFPALDLANTVKRTGWHERELLTSPDALESWLDVAALPAPRPAVVDEAYLAAVLAMRDPARRLLHAALGRGPWRSADAEVLNARLLAHPTVQLFGDGPDAPRRQDLTAADPLPLLLSRLAAEVRDACRRPDLAFCDAPGCGLLFYRHRANQAWCGTPCGNRARVARHHG